MRDTNRSNPWLPLRAPSGVDRRKALFILTPGPLPPEVGAAVMLRNGVAGGTLVQASRHSGLHLPPATYVTLSTSLHLGSRTCEVGESCRDINNICECRPAASTPPAVLSLPSPPLLSRPWASSSLGVCGQVWAGTRGCGGGGRCWGLPGSGEGMGAVLGSAQAGTRHSFGTRKGFSPVLHRNLVISPPSPFLLGLVLIFTPLHTYTSPGHRGRHRKK